jgi:6-phosphofructokinase 1
LQDAEDALAEARKHKRKSRERDKGIKDSQARIDEIATNLSNATLALSDELERRTNLESRVTILGHLQRGGTPSAADRLLATRLGAACADTIHEGTFGVMIAADGAEARAVPLGEVVGKRKTVPLDHPWVKTARSIGVSLGDT